MISDFEISNLLESYRSTARSLSPSNDLWYKFLMRILRWKRSFIQIDYSANLARSRDGRTFDRNGRWARRSCPILLFHSVRFSNGQKCSGLESVFIASGAFRRFKSIPKSFGTSDFEVRKIWKFKWKIAEIEICQTPRENRNDFGSAAFGPSDLDADRFSQSGQFDHQTSMVSC